MNMFNDHTLSLGQQQANHELWKRRYRDAPSMNEGVIGPGSGSGFICKDDPKAQEKLDARKNEAQQASNPQDRERLNLLLSAEMAEVNQGQKPARDAMAALVDYDHKHNHPITDLSRDLKSDPYTAHEQRAWFERDGRRKSSDETKALGDRNADLMFAPTKRQGAPDAEWHIHPSVKASRDAVRPVQQPAVEHTQTLSDGFTDKLAQRRGRHP